MSTPYELPVPPDLVEVQQAAGASVLPARAPLSVVPDADAKPLDFDDFVRRHSPRLRRLIVRKLGDLSEAEEIAQETLLRAHQHLHTLRTENELIAWTTVVGQRLAIDRMRVRGRSVAVAEVPEDARVGRDTADIVVARAEARTALDALESIPERQAAILWAREVEGLQYDAIAERFEITEPAVRSLLHRGRKALRAEYAARGGTLPFRGLVPLAPGLIALRGLGRLRDAARSSVKANAGAFATMTFAGALALGMGLGIGSPELRSPVVQGLGPSRVSQQDPSTVGVDVTAGSSGDRLGGTGAGGSLPGAPRRMPLDAVSAPCAQSDAAPGQRLCVSSTRGRGDVLYVGPALPSNPVIDRVGVSQNIVGVCEHVPGTPVTECSRGRTEHRLLPHNDLPPAIAAPSSIEGAQK